MDTKKTAEIEEKIISCISGDFKTGEVLSMVVGAIDDVGGEMADGWLELVQDALAQRNDTSGMLKLMVVRGKIGRISRRAIEEGLVHVTTDRNWQAKVKSVGFAGKAELAECFRRLAVLMALEEGRFCYEKTWGFGVVKRLDAFYSKVTVDFTRKKQHQMSFGYAGESLQLLEPTHLYVLQSRAPEKVAEIKKDAPEELVKMLLKSTGPQLVDDMKDLLVEMGILTDGEWKAFWDSARKGLKKDPLVDIPTKRTLPVTLLEKVRGYDEDWLNKLSKERDLIKLLVMFEGLAGSDNHELPDQAVEVVKERCAFIAKAAEGSQWDVLARLLIAGESLKDVFGENPVDNKAELFFEPEHLRYALRGLNVKLGTGLLEILMNHDSDKCSSILVAILEELPVNMVGDVAHRLETTGNQEMFFERISESIVNRTVGPVVFSWLCRTPGEFARLKNVGPYELVNGVIDMLEGEYNGEQLKGQNAIRSCFEDREWIRGLCEGLPWAQMETVVRRILESRGWESAGRRSVLAKMLKIYPELEKVLSASSGKEKEEGELRVSSWRSHRERSATLKKIVEVDIPENSKEIGVARSYGDLRENHEYKAAKEHQGILMRRQEELERDLKTVQGTNFEGFSCEQAGPGTMVAIRRPNGTEESYCVLGEWDRDERLRIISSESRLAQCLKGAVAGSKVILPGKSGDEECEVLSVGGLNDEIRAWVVSEPA